MYVWLINQDKLNGRSVTNWPGEIYCKISEHEIIPCCFPLYDQMDQDKFIGKSVMYAIANMSCMLLQNILTRTNLMEDLWARNYSPTLSSRQI